jgi:hypothetical protein
MRLPLTPFSAFSFALFTAACAAPQTAAPRAPAWSASDAPQVTLPKAGPEAFTIEGQLREEWLPLLKAPPLDPQKIQLSAAPSRLPPAPATCEAFVSRRATAPSSCGDGGSALAALDAALTPDDDARRDSLLAGIEECKGLPAGLARALRAELAPIECGEAVAGPALAAPRPGTSANIHQALLGLSIASRLARTANTPPKLSPPFSRARVDEFIKGPMWAWFTAQAEVIQQISQEAAALPGYARGLAAVEAGVAELRIVEAVRSAPLPDEMAKDRDLQTQYYGTLDQALEPRKDRGRDAALVGLRELAIVGLIRDARVDRARAMLSRLYGGRRIDALDALLLPPLAKAEPASVEERLARKLPTFYAGMLLDDQAATRPGTLRMLLDRGIPLPQRSALRGAPLTKEARTLLARGRIMLGQTYFRSVDFDQAAALLSAWPEGEARPSDATFALALAIALRGGPEDAADMMRKAPLALTGMGKVAALDYVTQSLPPPPEAGMAAFDAALIRQLTAPEGASADFFRELAARYQRAASRITAPDARALANERAKEAEQTAAALR